MQEPCLEVEELLFKNALAICAKIGVWTPGHRKRLMILFKIIFEHFEDEQKRPPTATTRGKLKTEQKYNQPERSNNHAKNVS